MKIIRFDEIGSTSDYAKELIAKNENVVVIATKQTGGKGTKGRSFSSNEGGVYLTKLCFYDNFFAKDAFLVMARTAVAVCKTLEDFDLKPKIKWANDVFVANKKICGILIENIFSGNKISSSLIGVGLNVNNDLPEELNEIATTMRLQKREIVDFQAVESKLLGYLNEKFSMDEYIKRVGYLNEEVTLLSGEEELTATLLRVEKDGGLVVKTVDGERKVFSGEISIRIRK
jgi:BirA family biotin operon repressor/biotin-[acetyl-CoA-carboxylase] ligase